MLLSPEERSLVLVVSFFFAVYLFNMLGFRASLSELDYASRFIILLPVFFYLRKANVRAEYFFLGIALGAIACGLFGFYQIFYLELPRAKGITNAVPFGDISIVLGLMCFSGVLLATLSRSFRFLMLVGFLMGLAGSILSGTRGGWIAIPVVLLVIIAMNPMKWSRVTISASTILLFFSLGAVYYFTNVQVRFEIALNQFNAYFSEGIVGTSVGLRLEVWRASILAISENPFFGIGEGNFHSAMLMLINEGRVDALIAEKVAHVHNEFLSATLHRGLIGLVSLMLVFIVPLRVFLNLTGKGSGLNQLLPISGVVLIISYMIFSLTDIVFGHQNTTLLYAACIFIIYGMIYSKR